MAPATFIFDYGSAYSYLVWTQLARLKEAGVHITFLPVPVLALQKRVGNSPTSITCVPKRNYVKRDLARWAKRYDVPLLLHPNLRDIAFDALRQASILARQRGEGTRFDQVIWSGLWVSCLDLTSVEGMRTAIAQAGLDTAPYDEDALLKAEESVSTNLDKAVSLGAFGTPTLLVNDELFFGNDRLDFVIEAVRADGGNRLLGSRHQE